MEVNLNGINPADKLLVYDHERKLVAKIYFSPDNRKLRIVLPEFSSLLQPLLNDRDHFIDFTRDVHTAKEELQRKRKGAPF